MSCFPLVSLAQRIQVEPGELGIATIVSYKRGSAERIHTVDILPGGRSLCNTHISINACIYIYMHLHCIMTRSEQFFRMESRFGSSRPGSGEWASDEEVYQSTACPAVQHLLQGKARNDGFGRLGWGGGKYGRTLSWWLGLVVGDWNPFL